MAWQRKASPDAAPGECIGARTQAVAGRPGGKHIGTCLAERQTLYMRMSMRRFIRQTNGFSMKAENHAYAVALRFKFYNFGRIRKTLRVTPAMQAEVSDHFSRKSPILISDPEIACPGRLQAEAVPGLTKAI